MAKASKRRFRRLTIEALETRRVLASLPFGATPSDTAEFMLGRIAVTPVLLESDGSIDTSTEDWTPQQVSQVMANIESGLGWWKELLATQSSVHTLDWIIDRTYVDNRLPTPYEPISRTSNAYAQWVPKFLSDVGFANSASLEVNMREFNNSQREKLNTDWSFTIFVVNSSNDSDGGFAAGGSFTRAFAFAGGLFQVIPSTRPASTYAHETGHMFWARDEYIGSGTYVQRRGYYNSQNENAIDLNPTPGFVQAPSIMSSGLSLEMAWSNIVSSPSTLAQIRWLDSDGDGIFDVLDVPLLLEGTGRMSENGLTYQFTGTASAQTLPNLNSAGSQNDITLNRVDRIEYRINGGNWFTAATPGTYTAQLNLSIPLSVSTGTIEIRAVEAKLGITSSIFEGTLGTVPDRTATSGLHGFVWDDDDNDNVWDANESGLYQATVTLIDEQGAALQLQKRIEASGLNDGPVPASLSGVQIDAIGLDTTGAVFVGPNSTGSAGSKLFKTYTAFGRAVETYTNEDQQFRARFDSPTTYATVDVIAVSSNTKVRLEAFNAAGELLQRTERRGLSAGQQVTLSVGSADSDISYVIVRGFDYSQIKISGLAYGPLSSTTTASDGSYSFPYLPSGNYNVQISGPNISFAPSEGSNNPQRVALALGDAVVHTDFGLYQIPSPWRNPTLAEDIDGDGSVSPVDVLELINEINRNGSRSLDSSTLVSPPYWDPDGDRSIGPLDVLQVVNYINFHGVGGVTSQRSQSFDSEGQSSDQAIETAAPFEVSDASAEQIIAESSAQPFVSYETLEKTIDLQSVEPAIDPSIVAYRISEPQASVNRTTSHASADSAPVDPAAETNPYIVMANFEGIRSLASFGRFESLHAKKRIAEEATQVRALEDCDSLEESSEESLDRAIEMISRSRTYRR